MKSKTIPAPITPTIPQVGSSSDLTPGDHSAAQPLSENIDRDSASHLGREAPTGCNGVSKPTEGDASHQKSIPAKSQPQLYRADDLKGTVLVIICDNESAADAVNLDLKDLGYLGAGGAVASTTIGGLASLHQTDLSPLLGKQILFFPSDDGGVNVYCNAFIAALGPNARTEILELPDRGPGGDYRDFRAAGGSFRLDISLERLVAS